jgi:hypothetical protein
MSLDAAYRLVEGPPSTGDYLDLRLRAACRRNAKTRLRQRYAEAGPRATSFTKTPIVKAHPIPSACC